MVVAPLHGIVYLNDGIAYFGNAVRGVDEVVAHIFAEVIARCIFAVEGDLHCNSDACISFLLGFGNRSELRLLGYDIFHGLPVNSILDVLAFFVLNFLVVTTLGFVAQPFVGHHFFHKRSGKE